MAEQWNLGQLIDALAYMPHDAFVEFDFGGYKPTPVNSYRGYYNQLAIGFEDSNDQVAVHRVLADLKAAVGRWFPGYKGGEYVMKRDTPMWVSNYGECHNTVVVGITRTASGMVIINTAHCEN